MDDDDPSLCGTCGLNWPRSERHPPCLKLSPEERRELGATAATMGHLKAATSR